MTDREKIKQKKYLDNIRMYFTFIITIIIMIIVGYMIYVMIPNTLDIEYITTNYIKSISYFEAEQSERIQFVVLTISFPILYILIYKIMQKIQIKVKDYKRTYNIFTTINVVAIAILIINIIKKELLIQSVLVGIIYIICFKIYNITKSKKIIKYCLYFATTLIICIISYLYINPTFEQLRYISHHVDAYYYPVLKITSGLTPYIDFTPLYGCYSYVFAFLQTIFNDNSLLFFSIINAIIVAIVLINFALIINRVIKNKVIAFTTFLAMLFPMVIQCYRINNGPYLQYMPHRVLFCSIILLFINIYLLYRKNVNKLILQIIGFIISAFAIFWNIETGLVVLIVWTAFLGYEVLYFGNLKDKSTYKQILKILIMAIMSLLLSFGIIIGISYIRTGQIILINNILESQILFYKDGFYMIKMQLGKPWMIVIYTYMIGLAISLRKLNFINDKRKILFNRNAMIFTLSILGIGIFSYYQGRSHDEVFSSVLYPFIILTGIFTEILLKRIYISREKKLQVSNIIITSIIILTISFFAMKTIILLIQNNNIHLHMNKEKLKNVTILDDFSNYDTSNMEFITEYESLYYNRYNLKDTKKMPALVDLFTYKDYEKVVRYLEQTEKEVIVLDKMLLNFIKSNKEYEQIIMEKFTIDKQTPMNIVLLNNQR